MNKPFYTILFVLRLQHDLYDFPPGILHFPFHVDESHLGFHSENAISACGQEIVFSYLECRFMGGTHIGMSPGEKLHNPFIPISLLSIGVSLNKQELVEYLVRYGYIKTEAVRNAFLDVPRDNFVLDKTLAWKDTPLPIPCNQTISAPSMIAIMLEALELARGDRVLEVGAGSGYNAALMAEIVGQENVVSVERIERLVEFACNNLKRCGYEIEIVVGDGTKGYPPRAPYDKIIVTAAAPTIPPPLLEQTRSGGLIAIPVGSRHFYQDFMLARKIDERRIEERNLGGCAFVPLVGEYGWRE